MTSVDWTQETQIYMNSRAFTRTCVEKANVKKTWKLGKWFYYSMLYDNDTTMNEYTNECCIKTFNRKSTEPICQAPSYYWSWEGLFEGGYCLVPSLTAGHVSSVHVYVCTCVCLACVAGRSFNTWTTKVLLLASWTVSACVCLWHCAGMQALSLVREAI